MLEGSVKQTLLPQIQAIQAPKIHKPSNTSEWQVPAVCVMIHKITKNIGDIATVMLMVILLNSAGLY